MTTKSEVVLFGPNKSGPRLLAIYKLATHLRNNGISVKNIWAWYISDTGFAAICRQVLGPETLLIGLSTTLIRCPQTDSQEKSDNFFYISPDAVRKRVELMRQLAPNAKIVIGGAQINRLPLGEKPVNTPGLELFDVAVKGQGEEALLAIVQSIKQGKRFKTTSLTPVVTGESVYPYENFNSSSTIYTQDDIIIDGEALPIEVARGCIFKCSYCEYPSNDKSKDDYTKPFGLLREEILRNYHEHGVRDYIFNDDLLNDTEEKVQALHDMAQSLPFQLNYAAFIRLDLIWRWPHTADLLRDSGLISAFFGIETINDRSGRAVGKGLGRARIDQGLQIISDSWKRKVMVTAGMIMGLPHDTPDTVHETLEWAKLPLTSSVINHYAMLPLTIFPMSPDASISENPDKYGYDVSRPMLNGRGDWVTRDYSFRQAIDDVEYFRDQVVKDLKFKYQVNWAELPYYLSLCDNRDDIWEVMMQDRSHRWATDQDWKQYLINLDRQHKNKYIKALLGGNK